MHFFSKHENIKVIFSPEYIYTGMFIVLNKSNKRDGHFVQGEISSTSKDTKGFRAGLALGTKEKGSFGPLKSIKY